MARLGASGTARAAPPIVVAARAPARSAPAVGAPALMPAVAVRAAPVPATAPRRCDPGDLATTLRGGHAAPPAPATRRASTALAASARLVAPVRAASTRLSGPVARPRAHAVRSGGEGTRLRTLRRSRVPWPELGRERLAAAWARVQADHGAAGELLLVGVYGPVALDAVTALALDPDGRAAMTFARRGAAGRRGDVALARVVATGRLVRSDIPHPATGWEGRPLR